MGYKFCNLVGRIIEYPSFPVPQLITGRQLFLLVSLISCSLTAHMDILLAVLKESKGQTDGLLEKWIVE